MSKKLVNLTFQAVSEEMENILGTYPESPYRQAFASCELRQELIAYVLSRIPNIHAVIDEGELPVVNQYLIGGSSLQQLHLESLIHIAINAVMKKNYN